MESESKTVTYNARKGRWSPLTGLPLFEHASRMKEVSLETIQSHLAHPKVQKVGRWDMVVEGLESEISDHIRDTFLLYKMHPQRIAEIVERVRKRRDDPLFGAPLLLPGAFQLEITEQVSEIDISVRRASFHDPPEDLDCLFLQMRLSSQETSYGRHEVIHELRAFLSWVWMEKDICRGASFVLATHSDDAARVLRRAGPGEHNTLTVGWEKTPIDQWRKEDLVRQQKIHAERRAARNCILCGRPLGRMQRLLGASKHKECLEFLD